MTTRNLNQTWRDVVFKQYTADLEADAPFPVRYLINIPVVYGLPGRDIWIEIPSKIELKTLRKAILAFTRATRDIGEPAYQDDHIAVRARIPQRQPPPDRSQYEDDDDDVADADTPKGGAGL